jgi:nucleotide-binding universal stress UspA family protein
MRGEISGIGIGEESRMGVLPERVLLATDGSEDAERATVAALDLAGRSGAELHVVHVWHDVRGFAREYVKSELRRRGQEVLDGEV